MYHSMGKSKEAIEEIRLQELQERKARASVLTRRNSLIKRQSILVNNRRSSLQCPELRTSEEKNSLKDSICKSFERNRSVARPTLNIATQALNGLQELFMMP